MFSITVIIPVRNGSLTLSRCLESILAQTISSKIEILILDSQSNDDSLNIAKKYKAKIFNIPVETFNHGLTRNLGANLSNSEFLYFTVQDAFIDDVNMLEKMLKHFDNASVNAVTGHQAVPIDKNTNPALWFNPVSSSKPEYRVYKKGEFNLLPNKIQLSMCNWDNVVAMYRRTALISLPFRNTNFSEDCLWAKDALNEGMLIARDPSLVVYHYHHENFRYRFKVNFIISYIFFYNFHISTSPRFQLIHLMKRFWRIFRFSNLGLMSKTYWCYYNFVTSLADFLSQSIFMFLKLIGGRFFLERVFNYFTKIAPQGSQRTKIK